MSDDFMPPGAQAQEPIPDPQFLRQPHKVTHRDIIDITFRVLLGETATNLAKDYPMSAASLQYWVEQVAAAGAKHGIVNEELLRTKAEQLYRANTRALYAGFLLSRNMPIGDVAKKLQVSRTTARWWYNKLYIFATKGENDE